MFSFYTLDIRIKRKFLFNGELYIGLTRKNDQIDPGKNFQFFSEKFVPTLIIHEPMDCRLLLVCENSPRNSAATGSLFPM